MSTTPVAIAMPRMMKGSRIDTTPMMASGSCTHQPLGVYDTAAQSKSAAIQATTSPSVASAPTMPCMNPYLHGVLALSLSRCLPVPEHDISFSYKAEGAKHMHAAQP